MKIDAPFILHRATVLPEWIDYNGHMRDAYYGVVFSESTDAFMDVIGMDANFRERTSATIYTLESHICYLQEVSLDESLKISAQLLDWDDKRARVFYTMLHGNTFAKIGLQHLT